MMTRWGITLAAFAMLVIANVAFAVEEAGETVASTEGLGNGVAIFGVAAVVVVGVYMASRASRGES